MAKGQVMTTPKMKQLVIVRDKWLRGDDPDLPPSELLNDEGEMCCLGFYLRQCGMPQKVLRNQASPFDVKDTIPKQARWLLNEEGQNSASCNSLISINDVGTKNDKKRERKIKKRFGKHNVEVKFV